MNITLRPRTRESVKTYFEKASVPEIRKVLPQKAKTVEEALEAYEKSLLPTSTSFGLTVWADGCYVGDVWCYCIDQGEEPNCMLSYCIFESSMWSRGIATEAVKLFLCSARGVGRNRSVSDRIPLPRYRYLRFRRMGHRIYASVHR